MLVTGSDVSGNGGLYYATYAYSDTFLAGALVARSYVAGETASSNAQQLAFWIGTALTVCMLFIWPSVVFPPYGSIAACLPYLILPIASAAILFSVLPLGRETMFARALTFGAMPSVGRLSYSIYLVHLLPIQRGPFAAVGDAPTRHLFVLSAILGLAVILHTCVERPFLRLKTREGTAASWLLWPVLAWIPLVLGAAFQFR